MTPTNTKSSSECGNLFYFTGKEEIIFIRTVPKGKRNKRKMSVEMTFAVLLRKWQASNEIRLKGGTKTRYENLINSHIIPELGELKLSEVNAETINGFLNEKLMRGRLDGSGALSPSYVRSISLVITSALNYAVTEGYIQAFKNRINKPSISCDFTYTFLRTIWSRRDAVAQPTA